VREGGDVAQDLNQVLSSELAGSTTRRDERRQANFGHDNLLSYATAVRNIECGIM
jgi:hypothetical protein